MNVYQYIDVFSEADGIGSDIIGLDFIFKELGYDSEIIARKNLSEKKILPLDFKSNQKNTIHILHYGGAGFPLENFLARNGKKFLKYHNMTPVGFFKNHIREDFYLSLKKKELESYFELETLSKLIDGYLFDSRFNYLSLTKILQKKILQKRKILPIAINYKKNLRTKKNSFQIVFIGRFVPNKKIEDLIKTLYFLNQLNEKYELHLIGKTNFVFQEYFHKIKELIEKLNLSSKVKIHSEMSEDEKHKILSESKFYLSMSEHEGFGIPVLEAIKNHTLSISYSIEATNELLYNSGLVFQEKDYLKTANLIHELNQNDSYYKKFLELQLNRLEVFENYPFKEKIKDLFQ